MIYLNNFIPIRVYYSQTFGLYRLETCYADRHIVEFNEAFIKENLPTFELQTTIYALNPRLFPPVPLGTSMFYVYQNHEPPYETRRIEWVAFPIMTTVSIGIGEFSFFTYITSPGPLGRPVFIRNQEKHAQITIDTEVIGNYFLKTPFYERVLDRDNFVLYFFDAPHLYWRGTTEALCVPSASSNDYPTLIECQRKSYPKLKNHVSYTGNSGIPLAEIKDKVFPRPRRYIPIVFWISSVMFFFIVILTLVKKILK